MPYKGCQSQRTCRASLWEAVVILFSGRNHPCNYALPQVNFFFFFFFFFFFLLFRATPVVYESSQAKGPIGATAAGLCHSYSKARSEPCLWPTLHLMATLDPEPTEQGQDWTRILRDTSRGFVTAEPWQELQVNLFSALTTCLPYSSPVLSNTVASSHMWLLGILKWDVLWL